MIGLATPCDACDQLAHVVICRGPTERVLCCVDLQHVLDSPISEPLRFSAAQRQLLTRGRWLTVARWRAEA